MEEIGLRSEGPGTVYLVGGATALLLGWRDQTIDIDLKLDPEPRGIFESIAWLKERLDVNVELAAPDQFIPALPGWKERSEFIGRHGPVEFFHYDFYGQALAKILRGYRTDVSDAKALVEAGRVIPAKLKDLFEEMKSGLVRYPGVNPDDFERKLNEFLEGDQG
jgi:hypothetical protein